MHAVSSKTTPLPPAPRTAADKAVDRYKALRRLNLSHPQAVHQAARELGMDWSRVQSELTQRSAAHRHTEARKAAQAPHRPDVAPASSVPAGDR